MEVTRELVERLAALAGKDMSESEKTRMGACLEEVLSRVTALERLKIEEELPGQEAAECI